MIRWIATTGAAPADALCIRREVFLEEQKFTRDADAFDEAAVDIVGYDGDEPFGTARVYREQGDDWHAGRIALRRPWRGRGLGALLLQETERQARAAGAKRMTIDAQLQAAGFYERCGYRRFGTEHYDEHCLHIGMCKDLDV